ncbi:MAG: hypothetical protein OXR68_03195 [Alphaproteobacteria bacterium]|nr:hypothetical protein [Alphaproteobacteria bacterium]MDD9919611.1 hypothetical protein [Alphaproteobacteria bacterium]
MAGELTIAISNDAAYFSFHRIVFAASPTTLLVQQRYYLMASVAMASL